MINLSVSSSVVISGCDFDSGAYTHRRVDGRSACGHWQFPNVRCHPSRFLRFHLVRGYQLLFLVSISADSSACSFDLESARLHLLQGALFIQHRFFFTFTILGFTASSDTCLPHYSPYSTRYSLKNPLIISAKHNERPKYCDHTGIRVEPTTAISACQIFANAVSRNDQRTVA